MTGPGDALKSYRAYTFDAAGNRKTMTSWNDASNNHTTTYNYGNRNQLTSHNGYQRFGSTSTGSMTYTWDERGNMKTQTGMSFEWNEDNRLTRVWTSSGDPKQEVTQVHYRYDHAGRRILQRNYNGPRTRHFFNGLTEEVRKVSVGTQSDDKFDFLEKITGDEGATGWTQSTSGVVTSVYNDERFSDVTRLAGNSWAYHGKHYNGGGTSWNVQDRRTVSAWVKTEGDGAFLIVVMNTSDQLRGLWYRFNVPPQGYTMAEPYQYIGNRALFGTHLAQDGKWRRLERDVVADFQAAYPSETFREIAGLTLTSYTATPVEIQNVRLGNSLTVEHNTLGGGLIGHILRNRRIDTQTYAATDTWLHYDQVGSVMTTSNDSGVLSDTRLADAFGNRLSSWESNLWANAVTSAGWGHNTKEYDADTGLVYMYQRWYNPETGTFLSKAPYPPMMEHAFGYAKSRPLELTDPSGRIVVVERPVSDLLHGLMECSPTFREAIRILNNSKRMHYIVTAPGPGSGHTGLNPYPPGSTNGLLQYPEGGAEGPPARGPGSGSTMNVNPNNISSPRYLAHEVAHGLAMDRGLADGRDKAREEARAKAFEEIVFAECSTE